MISGTTGLLGCADGSLLMQKKKRTALEATIDVVGRDQQDQILYLSKDPNTQIDCTAVENEDADNMYQRSELDFLIYNDPAAYAELILNGDPEAYLKTVTEYKPLDS